MEKKILLKGLTCPHCSGVIEREVGELPYVNSSSFSLMTQILTLDIGEVDEQALFADVKRITHSHEPDVEVLPHEQEHTHHEDCEHNHDHCDCGHCEDEHHDHAHSHGGDEDNKKRIMKIGTGAVIYIIGVILSHILELSVYITLPILVVAYIILGADVLLRAAKNIARGRVFDENFLMALSTVGAFVIGEYPEAVAVMLFYQIGEFFQDLAVDKSRRSISELMDIRPDSANVKRGEKVITVSPDDVKVGEIIIVRPGEKVPLDGEVVSGESMLDTRALTGESVPRKASIGDEVLSGCINENGLLEIRVTKAAHESTVSKILSLVENASSKKAPAENFITTFARYYTPVVVILALLLSVIPPIILGGGFADWVYRGFVFLVISCPCALVISIPLTFFGGIGAASSKGILVKGSNYLEALNNVDTLIFDKTGTLTKGVFKVTEVKPVDGYTADRLLLLAASAEIYSNHPIAKSIVAECGMEIEESALSDYKEISGRGVSVNVSGHTVLAGNDKLMSDNEIDYVQDSAVGTKVYVATDGNFIGSILISDEIKPDSANAMSALKKLGIKNLVMLTGDDKVVAENVARELNIDTYYAELLPGDKVQKLEELLAAAKEGGKVAFVGDGINDAPVLARADVGVAMGALGSDAAIEAADVVLMTDEPAKLTDAILIAKKTKKIVLQNIIFAIGVKVFLLILGALGIAGMWAAIFGDVGVMVIAVLNAMRALKTK